MKNIGLSFIVIFATTVLAPKFAFADTSSFPLCAAPQGTIIANYDTGSHGIAGQMSMQDGKDTVYSLDGNLNQVTQCYCPPTQQNGIQTNWLQVSAVSEEEKKQLLANGWIYIPNGSIWGLANTPYLAQNISYICNGSENSTPSSNTITAVVQSASSTNSNNTTSSSSNNNSSNNTSSSNTSGSLPNTGDSIVLFELIALGIVSISMSFVLKKLAA